MVPVKQGGYGWTRGTVVAREIPELWLASSRSSVQSGSGSHFYVIVVNLTCH
jgi:hypothetical protein